MSRVRRPSSGGLTTLILGGCSSLSGARTSLLIATILMLATVQCTSSAAVIFTITSLGCSNNSGQRTWCPQLPPHRAGEHKQQAWQELKGQAEGGRDV